MRHVSIALRFTSSCHGRGITERECVCVCEDVICVVDVQVLQCTATHCYTLQRTARHCNTLQLLQHTATHCNTLLHTNESCHSHGSELQNGPTSEKSAYSEKSAHSEKSPCCSTQLYQISVDIQNFSKTVI